jgi:hypothetical protein
VKLRLGEHAQPPAASSSFSGPVVVFTIGGS